jgi:hypothetical protein
MKVTGSRKIAPGAFIYGIMPVNRKDSKAVYRGKKSPLFDLNKLL